MNESLTDAIRVWAQKTDELWKGPNIRPLNQEEAHCWTKALYMERLHPEFNSDSEVLAELEKPAWQGDCILWRRIKACHTYTIDPTAVIALGYMIDRPGTSTMIANFLQYKCYMYGINHVSLAFLCERVFPNGWPTQEALNKAWVDQKGFDHTGDIPVEINLLDNTKYYETIKDLPDNKYKSIMPF